MKVILKKEKKVFHFSEGMTAKELIEKLGLKPPDAYVVYRENGKLIKNKEFIDANETVEVFSIVSGG